MPWKRAVYRCGYGHRHCVTLPDPPPVLAQPHGLAEGKPPRCSALLSLVKAEVIV
jgi:hypothetical protein